MALGLGGGNRGISYLRSLINGVIGSIKTTMTGNETSTTALLVAKAIYDWAVGKFIDLAKIVTTWSATPLDTNLASEKLVKTFKDEVDYITKGDLIYRENTRETTLSPTMMPAQTGGVNSFTIEMVADTHPLKDYCSGFMRKFTITAPAGNSCYTYFNSQLPIGTQADRPTVIYKTFWVKDSDYDTFSSFNIILDFFNSHSNSIIITLKTFILAVGNKTAYTTKTVNDGYVVSYRNNAEVIFKKDGWTEILITIDDITWVSQTYTTARIALTFPANAQTTGQSIYLANISVIFDTVPYAGFNYSDLVDIKAYPSLSGLNQEIKKLNQEIKWVENRLQEQNGVFVYDDDIDAVSYILTAYDESNNLKQTFKISRNSADNECFNFEREFLVNKSTLSETLIKGSIDDICPAYFNGTYIGANHGCAQVRKITCALHGKTFVDIGSKWTKGTNNFYIINIVDANSLWVLGENLSGTDIWNFALISGTSGTLTHVENATHTGNIVFTNSEVAQLKPANKIISRSIYADNKLIETSGTYNFNELNINEEYNILDPSSVLSKIIAAVGTFTANPVYNDLDADPVVRMSLNYKYKDDGTCLITTNFITYKDINIGHFGFIQTIPMNNNTKLYIPKALPISGKDFREIEDWGTATYITDNLTSEYWENAELPPDRFIFSDGTRGFIFGFLYDYGVGGDNKKNNINNSLYLLSTGKIYPHGIDDKLTIGAGEGYSATCFRKHLTEFNTDGIIGLTKFEHEDKYYIYADFNTIGIYEIEVPNDYIGKSINVFEKSSNVTVLSEISTEKILIDVATATPLYGYVVLKIN